MDNRSPKEKEKESWREENQYLSQAQMPKSN